MTKPSAMLTVHFHSLAATNLQQQSNHGIQSSSASTSTAPYPSPMILLTLNRQILFTTHPIHSTNHIHFSPLTQSHVTIKNSSVWASAEQVVLNVECDELIAPLQCYVEDTNLISSQNELGSTQPLSLLQLIHTSIANLTESALQERDPTVKEKLKQSEQLSVVHEAMLYNRAAQQVGTLSITLQFNLFPILPLFTSQPCIAELLSAVIESEMKLRNARMNVPNVIEKMIDTLLFDSNNLYNLLSHILSLAQQSHSVIGERFRIGIFYLLHQYINNSNTRDPMIKSLLSDDSRTLKLLSELYSLQQPQLTQQQQSQLLNVYTELIQAIRRELEAKKKAAVSVSDADAATEQSSFPPLHFNSLQFIRQSLLTLQASLSFNKEMREQQHGMPVEITDGDMLKGIISRLNAEKDFITLYQSVADQVETCNNDTIRSLILNEFNWLNRLSFSLTAKAKELLSEDKKERLRVNASVEGWNTQFGTKPVVKKPPRSGKK